MNRPTTPHEQPRCYHVKTKNKALYCLILFTVVVWITIGVIVSHRQPNEAKWVKSQPDTTEKLKLKPITLKAE